MMAIVGFTHTQAIKTLPVHHITQTIMSSLRRLAFSMAAQ